MADDIRELIGSVQDYLVRGGLDEDARYYLGPHVYEGLSRLASLGNFFGYGADVKDVASESAKVMEGDPAAFVGLPAALAMMAIPGSKSGIEEVIDKNIVKQLREQNIPDPKTGRFPVDKPVRGDFMTEKGSTYEWFDDATTQRYRVPHKPNDPDVGLQPVSGKTVFADPKDVDISRYLKRELKTVPAIFSSRMVTLQSLFLFSKTETSICMITSSKDLKYL